MQQPIQDVWSAQSFSFISFTYEIYIL